MKIAGIINDSTAEVKGHFADVIYFQGCLRDCCYCFNPELKSFDGGEEMSITEVMGRLSHYSNVVVLTGGEPACQDICSLIDSIRSRVKIVVLETSFFNPEQWIKADKVLICLKTFDVDPEILKAVNEHDNAIPVVVICHDCFNIEGFKEILRKIKKDIYFRYCNGKPPHTQKIYSIIKRFNKPFKVFDKICL